MKLRYDKQTKHPDGSISYEEGNTFLGNVRQWAEFGFWILAALLFWCLYPLIHCFCWLVSPAFRKSDGPQSHNPPYPSPAASWDAEPDKPEDKDHA